MVISAPEKKKRYTLHIGFNDMDTDKQKLATERIRNLIYSCLRAYRVSFSDTDQYGGWCSPQTNAYITEKGMHIVIIGAPETTVNEIAADICCFLHQASVAVVVDEVVFYTVSERLPADTDPDTVSG